MGVNYVQVRQQPATLNVGCSGVTSRTQRRRTRKAL